MSFISEDIRMKMYFSYEFATDPGCDMQVFLIDLTHYSPVLLFYTPWKHRKT